SRADASRAIQNLNGKELGGRPLRVNEAQERSGGGNRGGGAPQRWEALSDLRPVRGCPDGVAATGLFRIHGSGGLSWGKAISGHVAARSTAAHSVSPARKIPPRKSARPPRQSAKSPKL